MKKFLSIFMLVAIATMCITMSSCSKEKHPVRDMVLAQIKGTWITTNADGTKCTLTFGNNKLTNEDQVSVKIGDYTPMDYYYVVNEQTSTETSYVLIVSNIDATIKINNISATQMDITATGKFANQFDGTYHK